MDINPSSDETIYALHEANEYLRAIFDSIRDYAVFTVTLDNRIATWNTGAERVFGWSEIEAIGQSGAMIFTPEDRERKAPEAEITTAFETGVAEDNRWHLRRDGSRFFASGTMRQLRDQENNLRGFIKVTRDATGDLLRQQAEEALTQSEEKYRTLFESIDTGFCITEILFDENEKPVDYRFIEVNPAFERHTGIHNPVGRTMREIAPLHEDYWFERYGRIALTGEPVHFENAAQQLHRYFDVYAFRIGDASKRQVAILFTDIKERIQREQNDAFLTGLIDDFSYAPTSDDMLAVVGAKIYSYFDLSRLSFAYVDEDADAINLIFDRCEPGLPDLLGEHRLSTFMNADFLDGFRIGQVFAIDDIAADPRTSGNLEQYNLVGVRSHLLAPFIDEGRWRFVLSLGKSEPYAWRTDQIELLQVIAPRIYLGLERARIEMDERDQRILAERLNERQKFARDLHDAVSQTLFSASIISETLPRVARETPDHLPALLLELHRMIKGAQAEMRTLLLELRPANVQSTPLPRLLRQLVDTVQGRKRTEVTLTFDGEVNLPPDVHITVYRIAQEAVNNMIKHANAQQAWVTGRGGNGFIELRFRDNGTGFDLENPSTGLGIQMMRERAEEIDARLDIHSGIDSGTDVHLIYPRTEPSQL